jgi:hypothetical protein
MTDILVLLASENRTKHDVMLPSSDVLLVPSLVKIGPLFQRLNVGKHTETVIYKLITFSSLRRGSSIIK